MRRLRLQKLFAATGRLGDTVKSLLPDRVHLLFADGEVWTLSPDTPIDAVKPFFTHHRRQVRVT